MLKIFTVTGFSGSPSIEYSSKIRLRIISSLYMQTSIETPVLFQNFEVIAQILSNKGFLLLFWEFLETFREIDSFGSKKGFYVKRLLKRHFFDAPSCHS